MGTSYSRDPDTFSSYHHFSILRKSKIVAYFLDANLILVAPSVGIQAGLPVCATMLLAENAYF
jgi:hypothetical protein